MSGCDSAKQSMIMAVPPYLCIDGATLNQVHCALQDGAALQSDKVHQITFEFKSHISVKYMQQQYNPSLPHPPCLQRDELGQRAGKEATVAEAEAAVH